MRKTAVIICTVGLLGLLGYGVRQHGAGSLTLTSSPPSNTRAGSSSAASSQTAQTYKDGTYTGQPEDNPYGTVQIAVVISGGKISDVNFLQMPSGFGHTDEVTSAAEPLLKQSTLSAQSANIDFVSGATLTSQAFQQSLQTALDQAAAA